MGSDDGSTDLAAGKEHDMKRERKIKNIIYYIVKDDCMTNRGEYLCV
jgi:hypothetical protein